MVKRLYRSNDSKVFAGVCGGLGEYFEIDPVLVRIITVILFLATGFGVLAYIVAWIVMPRRPAGETVEVPEYTSWHKYLPGLVLIAVGAVLLLQEYWYWFDFGELWPVLLIIAGIALILMRPGRRNGFVSTTDPSDLANNQHAHEHENGGPV